VEETNQILNEFQPISLKEMDKVALMNRVDTKFVFALEQLPLILKQIQNDYRILDINNVRVNKYESLYFDTKNLDLYYNHHRGKLNRYKIRFRKYVESNLLFFEVKFKTSKKRTIKNRIKQIEIDEIIKGTAEELMLKKTNLISAELEPKIWINYSRITFVSKNTLERVTIDLNLSFKNDVQEKTIDNLVIAEVKQGKFHLSPFINIMKKYHIRQKSISKYCYGIVTLYNSIKHNNFKPKLILIKKILNDTYTSA
jgi:hypothetical protein